METPRQRFIRNGEENARIVRARQRQAELSGDFATAEQIGAIQDRWDAMLQQARDLESMDAASENN